MKSITSDYDTHTKDELLIEAQSRNIIGASQASTKADLILVLQRHDMAKQPPTPTTPQAPAPFQKPKGSGIPQLASLPANIPTAPGDAPRDDEYGDSFTKDDGEPYALAIVNDAPNGRTHWAKNSLHTWNGTAEEFKAQFEKK